jgi:orotate phosphoribosyltransferase
MNQNDSLLSRESFVEFALAEGVLRFGGFLTKSGRMSPYFFNAGLFNHGASIARLGEFYADTLMRSGTEFDMLFGPAYKGISLATATAMALARHPGCAGKKVPFAFNRKEAKAHGEGGTLVGAPLHGRVVIIDDVITAGTSVHESVQMIRDAGAEPAAVLIALDRMERGGNATEVSDQSAVQQISMRYGMPVHAIASLDDILGVIAHLPDVSEHKVAIQTYRDRYGVQA